MAPAAFAGIADRLLLRSQFGTDDLARLQHELQVREADLERYSHKYTGVSNSQIVEGFLATYQRPNGLYFSDPTVPPLFFKLVTGATLFRGSSSISAALTMPSSTARPWRSSSSIDLSICETRAPGAERCFDDRESSNLQN